VVGDGLEGHLREWLSQHLGLSLAEAVALSSLALGLLLAILRPVRRAFMRASRLGWLLVRIPERRYAQWFVDTYGRYENPYLDDTEDLDLRRTYVSLYFRGSSQDPEVRISATDAIGRWSKEASGQERNIVIEGDPGSGKSTLLRAYGVGLLRHQKGASSAVVAPGKREVPFFVSLRKLAAELDRKGGAVNLAEYLIREVLVRGIGMSQRSAEEFFGYVLSSGRCLVLLDGLDEVTTDRYESVKAAVYRFVDDRNPARPTHFARLIISCRRQNLLSIRDEWVGPVASQAFRLSPLRTSEIVNYLENIRGKFKLSNGPEEFMAAVRSSGTFELHRTPLVLAMSVGLFVRKGRYEIPRSISELYRLMVTEMLDRHRFKGELSSVQFRVKDKYRALREFALHAARGMIGFGEFTRRDLVDFVRPLARQLEAVSTKQVDAFVDEIVNRSGLLSDVSDSNSYVFAHRSIQEYLVAEELRLHGPDGTNFLLIHAVEQEWRQVILFVAAAQDQRLASPMLQQLASINLPLASHCLAGADAPDEVAEQIILNMATQVRSSDDLTQNLAALLAATGSPRLSVQAFAVDVVRDVLTDLITRRNLVTLLGGDTAAVVRVLATLSNADAAAVTALVPTLAAAIPDDPSLVEPLWRCLATPDLDNETAKAITNRLVGLAMDLECFIELQSQDPISQPFLTQELRHRAYPFTRGQPLASNLVTLLAWIEFLGMMPTQSNRFFDAKRAGQLSTVERDRSRTIVFRPFWPVRIISGISFLVGLVGSAFILVAGANLLLRPYGWWTLLIILVCSLPALLLFVIDYYWDDWAGDDFAYGPFPLLELLLNFVDINYEYLIVGGFLFVHSLLLSVSLVPLLAVSVPVYVTLSVFVVVVVCLAPWMRWVDRGCKYYLWRPNPYVDVYDEPKSQLWLTRSESSMQASARGRFPAESSRARN
jgi:NACHT domain